MTFPFLGGGKNPRFGGWWLGLVLLCPLLLLGCKTWRDRDDGLRRNDLAEPARQLRTKTEAIKDKDAKAADDPWMSEKAQKISRDLQ